MMQLLTRRAPYDAVAAIYDAHWGQDFTGFARDVFQEHLADTIPRSATVLDLCCGTGLFLAHLETLGYRVHGVDESARMLEWARRAARHAQLQQADMASFHWDARFDAVVCLYNSVNHARSVEHLRATLANVAAHLAPHGLLLFDYVSHDSFEQSWECDEEIEMEDGVRTIHYVYERSGRRASCVIDRGRRIDQTMFAAGEIEESLASTGFTVVRETSLAGPTLLPSRQLVLARRTINL